MKINDIQFNCDLIDILQELIAQLRVNGIELIQKYKEGPTHIQICCPYHSNGMERRPSAGLRKEDGLFHCFACGEVHSLQEVISYCFGYTDDIVGKFGWQWLLKNFITIQQEVRKDIDIDVSRRNFNNRFSSMDNIKYVTEEELDKYRYIHPYMYKRGLTDEIIQLFDIGFDCDSNCITFPVRDISGRCLFIARRSVRTKYFSYPKGVEKPLYGLYEIDCEVYNFISRQLARDIYGNIHKPSYEFSYPSEIIVCESMLDALSFWTVGKYAVALNGLGNELQIKQLLDLPCREIILATDMDEKGLNARINLKRKLQDRKIVKQYMLPEGRKDANECTKEELLNLKEVFI